MNEHRRVPTSTSQGESARLYTDSLVDMSRSAVLCKQNKMQLAALAETFQPQPQSHNIRNSRLHLTHRHVLGEQTIMNEWQLCCMWGQVDDHECVGHNVADGR